MVMNGAQLHLLLNHVPVLLPITGLAVLGVGLWRKAATVQAVGLALIVVGGILALPAYFTGEPAEGVVKNYPMVSREAIEQHEDSALPSLIVLEVTALASLVLLWQISRGREPARRWLMATLLLGVVGFVLMARTAHLGGLIRHEELQSGPGASR